MKYSSNSKSVSFTIKIGCETNQKSQDITISSMSYTITASAAINTFTPFTTTASFCGGIYYEIYNSNGALAGSEISI